MSALQTVIIVYYHVHMNDIEFFNKKWGMKSCKMYKFWYATQPEYKSAQCTSFCVSTFWTLLMARETGPRTVIKPFMEIFSNSD